MGTIVSLQNGWGAVMPRDGSPTRNKIMDVAQNMVLDVGLSGTSVEKVIDEAGVTIGTFFTISNPSTSGCHPRIPIENYQLADHLLRTFEGAFILSKVMNEHRLTSQQLIQCRNYTELLFAPEQ